MPHTTTLLEAEQKTLLFSRGEFNFPDTPAESLDSRTLRVDSFGRTRLFLPVFWNETEHEWQKRPYHKGWKHTEEAKKRISEARKRYWNKNRLTHK